MPCLASEGPGRVRRMRRPSVSALLREPGQHSRARAWRGRRDNREDGRAPRGARRFEAHEPSGL